LLNTEKTKGNKSEGVTLTQSVSDRWGELNLKMSAQDGTCSEGNAQQGYPSLCKNGCGFFSSVDSKGFCSVCYKDFLKKEQSSTEATEEVAATTASLSNLNVSVEESEAASSPAAAAAESSEPEVVDGAAAKSVLEQAAVSEPPAEEPEEAKEPKKVKKNRCASCKKKVGLTGFACRCGGMYCGIHRYSDKHNCTFDYGALGKSEIAAANPVIVAEKVAKI